MKLMKYLEKKYGYGADLNMAGVGNIFKISENKRSFAVKTPVSCTHLDVYKRQGMDCAKKNNPSYLIHFDSSWNQL